MLRTCIFGLYSTYKCEGLVLMDIFLCDKEILIGIVRYTYMKIKGNFPKDVTTFYLFDPSPMASTVLNLRTPTKKLELPNPFEIANYKTLCFKI